MDICSPISFWSIQVFSYLTCGKEVHKPELQLVRSSQCEYVFFCCECFVFLQSATKARLYVLYVSYVSYVALHFSLVSNDFRSILRWKLHLDLAKKKKILHGGGIRSLYMAAIEPIRRSPYSSHLSPYQNILPSLWTIHPLEDQQDDQLLQ